jgi:lysyl-tRNA synthetase class 2
VNDWQPSCSVAAARDRAAILQRLRHYFDRQAVLEVDTPALSLAAVSDTQIESLEVRSTLASPLYLHTSPEFAMKRLLAADYPDIYSICRVFRDGESGNNHQPEFTMVEWYRRDYGLREIVQDAIGLICAALNDVSLAQSCRVLEYRDAFVETTGLDPATASHDELLNAAGADDNLRNAIGDERDDILDLLLATRVIPQFEADTLTVIQHYPASQAALARLCDADNELADRFEVFMGPVELANGYVELTDATQLEARMQADQQQRQRRGRPVRPLDDALLAAHAHGLPDCAGVALGLERLHMVLEGCNDIRDVVTFAFQDSQ